MDRMYCYAAVACGLLLPGSLLAQQGKPAPAPVVTAEVTEEVISELKTYVGTVVPLKRAVVGSAVDGRVTDVYVEVGDRVEVGPSGLAPLAQLLTQTIDLEFEAAKQELNLRKQEFEELKNGSLPEEIEQAEAQLLGAQAMMDFTKARAQRNKSLYQQSQGISSDEVEESMALAVRASQTFAEAKAAYDLIVQGPREERKAQAAARLAMQQAMTEQLKDRINKYTVVSRFSGYVVRKLAEEGQWLKQGDPVAEVVHLDQVEIEVHVSEQNINSIDIGRQIEVEIPAAGKQPFRGTISRIVPQADVRTRTFPIRILVDNSFKGELPVIKSGMYARATLPTGTQEIKTLVPKDALVLGGQNPLVFVVRENKAVPIPLTLKAGDANRIEVLAVPPSKLQAGDRVVVEGNERLRPGQDVEVIRTKEISADVQPDAGTTAGLGE